MSKGPARRRSNQPPVPPLAPETVRALLGEAKAFETLAPWQWMYDSELVGLRHPATGEKLLCSILGRFKTVFALAVYRRDAGRRWILNTIMSDEEDGDLDEMDNAMEQDCIKVEFVRKGDLTKEDKAMLAVIGYTPAGKSGCVWPVARSMEPAGLPWFPTQAEAETLLFALPRVAAFATLVRDTEGLGVDLATGEVPFLPVDFDPASRPLRTGDLDWEPQVPPPAPAFVVVSWDEETLARLRALPQAAGFHLEVDMSYSHLPVLGRDRPFFPKAALAVDRASGFIGGMRMAGPAPEDEAQTLAGVLSGAMLTFEHRPEAIHVQRRRVAQLIVGAAGALKIPVLENSRLEVLNAAREEMERALRR